MKFLAQVNIGATFLGDPASPLAHLTGVSALVSLIIKGVFAIAGVLILFFFVMAGFQIIVGAGQNNPEAAKKGQEAATAAALGFAVVFVAYWIVRLIEVITGVSIIS